MRFEKRLILQTGKLHKAKLTKSVKLIFILVEGDVQCAGKGYLAGARKGFSIIHAGNPRPDLLKKASLMGRVSLL